MRAFEYAVNQTWAIRAQYRDDGTIEAPELELILNAAQRVHDPDFAAVIRAQERHAEARAAALKPVNGVAQINAIGPIFRYGNLFTKISGGATVSGLQADLQAAIDDSSVRAILLNIDSPGGQVEGISDLAEAIRSASSKKPIHAFSDGTMASAAYWLGSAAKRITVSDTALVGSLGVVATLPRKNGKEKESEPYEFVSSISPKKRINVETDDGKSQVQAIVDSTAAVFLQKVADYRGVSFEKVQSDFGQGGVLVGAEAVACGMADKVGTRDSVLASLLPRERTYSFGALSAAKNPQIRSRKMDIDFTAEQQAAVTEQLKAENAQARAEARKAERERIAAILNSPEAAGREALARKMALSMDMSPEDAISLLSESPKAAAETQRSAVDSEFSRQMARVKNPQVGADADADNLGDKTPEEQTEYKAKFVLSAGRR
jgi:ClpP class serine protease